MHTERIRALAQALQRTDNTLHKNGTANGNYDGFGTALLEALDCPGPDAHPKHQNPCPTDRPLSGVRFIPDNDNTTAGSGCSCRAGGGCEHVAELAKLRADFQGERNRYAATLAHERRVFATARRNAQAQAREQVRRLQGIVDLWRPVVEAARRWRDQFAPERVARINFPRREALITAVDGLDNALAELPATSEPGPSAWHTSHHCDVVPATAELGPLSGRLRRELEQTRADLAGARSANAAARQRLAEILRTGQVHGLAEMVDLVAERLGQGDGR